MATIQTGSGETFKTTTAEGRLIECICFIRQQELDTAKNPNEQNAVIGDFSIGTFEFSGTFNIPCTAQLTTTGSISIVAAPYLSGVTFNPGSGTPSFKSSTVEGYLLEVVTYIQALEANTTKNPQGLNNVTGNYNSDTGIYSGTFAIPITLLIGSSGEASFAAQEYLLT